METPEQDNQENSESYLSQEALSSSRQNKPRNSLLQFFDPLFNKSSGNVSLSQLMNEKRYDQSIQEDDSEIFEDCVSDVKDNSGIEDSAVIKITGNISEIDAATNNNDNAKNESKLLNLTFDQIKPIEDIVAQTTNNAFEKINEDEETNVESEIEELKIVNNKFEYRSDSIEEINKNSAELNSLSYEPDSLESSVHLPENAVVETEISEVERRNDNNPSYSRQSSVKEFEEIEAKILESELEDIPENVSIDVARKHVEGAEEDKINEKANIVKPDNGKQQGKPFIDTKNISLVKADNSINLEMKTDEGLTASIYENNWKENEEADKENKPIEANKVRATSENINNKIGTLKSKEYLTNQIDNIVKTESEIVNQEIVEQNENILNLTIETEIKNVEIFGLVEKNTAVQEDCLNKGKLTNRQATFDIKDNDVEISGPCTENIEIDVQQIDIAPAQNTANIMQEDPNEKTESSESENRENFKPEGEESEMQPAKSIENNGQPDEAHETAEIRQTTSAMTHVNEQAPSPGSKVIETAVKFVNALTLPMFLKSKPKEVESEIVKDHIEIKLDQEICASDAQIINKELEIAEIDVCHKIEETVDNSSEKVELTELFHSDSCPINSSEALKTSTSTIKMVNDVTEKRMNELRVTLDRIAESSKGYENEITVLNQTVKERDEIISKMRLEIREYNAVLAAYDSKMPEFAESYAKLKSQLENAIADNSIYRKVYYGLNRQLQAITDQEMKSKCFIAKLENNLVEKEKQILSLQNDLHSLKEENDSGKQSEELTTNRLNAIIKRYEMKVNSLENALKLKSKEFEDLSALYDNAFVQKY